MVFAGTSKNLERFVICENEITSSFDVQTTPHVLAPCQQTLTPETDWSPLFQSFCNYPRKPGPEAPENHCVSIEKSIPHLCHNHHMIRTDGYVSSPYFSHRQGTAKSSPAWERIRLKGLGPGPQRTLLPESCTGTDGKCITDGASETVVVTTEDLTQGDVDVVLARSWCHAPG